MKTRQFHIYTHTPWNVEIIDPAKLRRAWQAHCTRCGLDVTQDDYLEGLVLRVISEGFDANKPEITGVVLRAGEIEETRVWAPGSVKM